MTNATDTARAFWALCYHSNSHAPRSRKWYRVSRLVEVDGKTFCVYWGPGECATSNRTETKNRAMRLGFKLAPGVYTNAPSPRHGDEMIRSN